MKVSFRPKMQEVFEDVEGLWITRSATKTGVSHITVRFANNIAICSCDGYQFNQSCWHVKEVAYDT